jgi:hypothetical protein
MMKDTSSWFNLGLLIALLSVAIFFFHGCASSPPSMSITEADIDAKIAAIGAAVPNDPEADVYNETTSKYELTPAAHDRALRDGMVKDIQDEKISGMVDYLAKNPPQTFWDRVKLFGIGFILGVLTGAAGGVYISK